MFVRQVCHMAFSARALVRHSQIVCVCVCTCLPLCAQEGTKLNQIINCSFYLHHVAPALNGQLLERRRVAEDVTEFSVMPRIARVARISQLRLPRSPAGCAHCVIQIQDARRRRGARGRSRRGIRGGLARGHDSTTAVVLRFLISFFRLNTNKCQRHCRAACCLLFMFCAGLRVCAAYRPSRRRSALRPWPCNAT